MKKLLYIFFFIFSISFVYASEDIDVQLSKDQVQIWEMFELALTINTAQIAADAVEVDIPGIENFQVFSQSQSQKYSSVNGDVQSTLTYNLQLQAKNEGEFSLWPVLLKNSSGETQDDTTLTISVGNTLSPVQNTKNTTDEETPKTESIEKNNEKISEYFSSLKWLRSPTFPRTWFFLFLVWFLGIFFLILKKYFSKQEDTSEEVLVSSPQQSIYAHWRSYLERTLSQKERLPSQEFAQKINTLYREILLFEWIHISKTATLKELQKNDTFQKHPLKSWFEQSYFWEFHESSLSSEMLEELEAYLLSREQKI